MYISTYGYVSTCAYVYKYICEILMPVFNKITSYLIKIIVDNMKSLIYMVCFYVRDRYKVMLQLTTPRVEKDSLQY